MRARVATDVDEPLRDMTRVNSSVYYSASESSSGSNSESDSSSNARDQLLRRLKPPSELAAEHDRQRRRTNWQAAGIDDRRVNPTFDGLAAGSKYGALSGVLGGTTVFMLHRLGPSWFRGISIGGKVWIVTVAAMAGFFVCSEQAVVGTEARAKAIGG